MKHLKHLFTALLLLCSLTATAHNFEIDGIYYNITNDTNKTVEVTYKGNYYYSYSDEYTGSVVIPENVTYNGTTYSVTSIGEYAFWCCDGLTSITIPNSVTSIGKLAFFCCNNLTSVEIPNSVTSIGEDAFSRTAWYNNQPDGVVYAGKVLYKYKGTMPSNTSITIKDGTLSITDYAFSGCSGLTNIRIPNSVTRIGWEAFWNCSGLTSITLEAGNTKYDSRENCNAIIETATNTLVTGCKNSVIPNSVTRIGNWAFYECYGLTSVVIPNNVTSIGKYAFLDCTGLKNVEFNAENCTSMGSYDYQVFIGCTALSTVVIGENVKTIPDQAFRGCSNVETLYIGSSVASIGSGAFAGCEKITEIKVALEKPISGRANIFAEAVYDNATLYVPTGTEPLYQKHEPWNRFFYIKEMDFTGIDEVLDEVKAESGKVKAIYDLNGRVVENPSKGMYIIDGKKVLIN